MTRQAGIDFWSFSTPTARDFHVEEIEFVEIRYALKIVQSGNC
jgi:hypothetical protein